MQAILLIAHGSRLAKSNEEVLSIGEHLQRADNSFVAVGFLELAEPSIPTAARLCVSSGASEILMMPFFLSPGRHVTNDLNAWQADLNTEFPHVNFQLCSHLGTHPAMIQIVRDRLNESRHELSDHRPHQPE